MDIGLLKTFLEVKNTKHFGRAAENLYLTQAAVSARIKQLETTLGVSLFTRYRNNLQLTPSGEKLIEHAESIISAWERAKIDVKLKKKQESILSIGGTNGLWDLILHSTLSKIHQRFESITLIAESLGQDVLIRRLMERTLDMCLVYEPAKIQELKSIQVANAELTLMSTQKNISVSQALNKGYVSVDWGTAFGINFSHAFTDLEQPAMHTSLSRIALEFILDNGGSAYLPMQMVEHLVDTELFKVDGSPVFNRPIYCCYHSENKHTKIIEEIAKIVSDLTHYQ